MAIINYVKREVVAKIVYYGPGLCGKTTNLVRVHENMGTNDSSSVGEMQSLATESDRTLFFDFVPIQLGKIAGFEARFQLFTVPGQVFYNETRRIVLKDADGIVFIADSQPSALVNNIESLQNLEENLASHGKSLEEVPYVIQYNKQDLPDAMSQEELEEVLNNKHNVPSFRASAFENWGVMETLAKTSSLVLERLRETMANPKAAAPNAGVKRTYSKETVNDDEVVGDLLQDIAAARTGGAEGPNAGPKPRADGAVPGGSPVETSSIKPEDLLAEFDEPSMPEPPSGPIPHPPPIPAPVPSGPPSKEGSVSPQASTVATPSPPVVASEIGPVSATSATSATMRAPTPMPRRAETGGGSAAGAAGQTAEDLLKSLEDDPSTPGLRLDDPLGGEPTPFPVSNPGNGGGVWDDGDPVAAGDSTRLQNKPPAAADGFDPLGDNTRVRKDPPAGEAASLDDLANHLGGDAFEDATSEHSFNNDRPPPPPPAAIAQAPVPEASLADLGDAIERTPAPPPPVPHPTSTVPPPPPGMSSGTSPGTPAPRPPSKPGRFSLVEAGPATAAGKGIMKLPLTLRNEEDGVLTTVSVMLSTGDLPGKTSQKKGGGGFAIFLALLALLLGGAALAFTLMPELLQNFR